MTTGASLLTHNLATVTTEVIKIKPGISSEQRLGAMQIYYEFNHCGQCCGFTYSMGLDASTRLKVRVTS
jgi:hypothetical protein